MIISNIFFPFSPRHLTNYCATQLVTRGRRSLLLPLPGGFVSEHVSDKRLNQVHPVLKDSRLFLTMQILMVSRGNGKKRHSLCVLILILRPKVKKKKKKLVPRKIE